MRSFLLLLSAVFIAHSSLAQEPKRVGMLFAGPKGNFVASVKAFNDGMAEHGFSDGSVRYLPRYIIADPQALAAAAQELVAAGVAVMLTPASMPTEAAHKTTSNIPIVFTNAGDPVASGFVDTLERPGRNITGVIGLGADVAGKRLDVIKEAIPSLKKVAVIGDSTPVQQASSKDAIITAARRVGVEVLFADIKNGDDIPAAFGRSINWGAEAFITLSQTLTNNEQESIVSEAAKHGKPVLVHTERGARAGALISLNDDANEIFRLAGKSVALILTGSSPADMPVIKARKLNIILNEKTARALQIRFPASLLAQATNIIR